MFTTLPSGSTINFDAVQYVERQQLGNVITLVVHFVNREVEFRGQDAARIEGIFSRITTHDDE